VRKELAQEEEARLAEGGVSLHTTSASVFVVLALELEEAQCVFQECLLSNRLTITQGDDFTGWHRRQQHLPRITRNQV